MIGASCTLFWSFLEASRACGWSTSSSGLEGEPARKMRSSAVRKSSCPSWKSPRSCLIERWSNTLSCVAHRSTLSRSLLRMDTNSSVEHLSSSSNRPPTTSNWSSRSSGFAPIRSKPRRRNSQWSGAPLLQAPLRRLFLFYSYLIVTTQKYFDIA